MKSDLNVKAPHPLWRFGHFFSTKPYFLLAFAGLFWSGNHIVGRAAADQIAPFTLSMARWLAPLFILWPFVRPRLARDWPIIRAHWRIVGVLGLTGRTAFGVLQYVGLKYTTALNTSVLNSASPVMIVVVSALLFGDPLRVRQVLGISVSLFGVLVIVSRADVAVLSALQFNWGDLIILLNMAIFAFYSSVLRLRPNVHPLSFLFVFAAVSTIGTIPFLVAELLIVPAPALSWANFGFLLYVGIFPSLVSFIAWNRGVELIGPNRAGAFLHLVPFYSALMAVALLGESLEIFHFVGFALILGGEAEASKGAVGRSNLTV